MSKIRLILVILVAGSMGAVLASARQQNRGEQLFRDVLQVVSSRYVEPLDGSEILEKAAKGLLDQLDDPYAHLYPPKEQDEFTQQHQGNYGGVGMTIEDRDGVHTVVRVFRDTPAERAGFQEGDRILTVDGAVVRGWALEKVTGRIKGQAGTKVTLEYEHVPGSPVKTTVTRAIVNIPEVPYVLKVNETGYIPLLQFGNTASDEVAKALRELKQQGATSFVLDLRGNGGGLLEEAVEISDLFLPAGSMVVEQRERVNSQKYTARDAADENPAPVVILVDGGTASASEIVAGALQDHDRALILGEATYGKGVVQTVYQVGGNNLLKLTTGEWLTPSGRSIHRKREKDDAGRWSVVDDSAAMKKKYKSDSGRALSGNGGISPDRPVRNDTLSTVEVKFIETVRPQSTEFYLAYTGLAAELKDQVKPGFTVKQEWLDEIYKRLQTRGVKVPREQYDAARGYVSDLLALRIARSAFGDAEAKRMFVQKDPQLAEALKLLKASRTQKDLLAANTRSTPGS
jgi:carboxyl-terminal processing protease